MQCGIVRYSMRRSAALCGIALLEENGTTLQHTLRCIIVQFAAKSLFTGQNHQTKSSQKTDDDYDNFSRKRKKEEEDVFDNREDREGQRRQREGGR